MSVYLLALAERIAAISTIIGVALAAYRLLRRALERAFDAKLSSLEKRYRKQQELIRRQQEDSASVRHSIRVITRSVQVCLEGLREQGFKGAVSNAIESLDEFLLQQAIKDRLPEIDDDAA